MGLPAISALDALRESSQLSLSELDGIQTLERSTGTSEIGSYLKIDAGAEDYAWGLYSLDAQDGFLISLEVQIISEANSVVWIGVSDYDTQRWQWAGPFNDTALLTFNDSGYVSPGGSVYCAAVVTTGNKVRVQRLILKLNTNNPPVADCQPGFRAGPTPLSVQFGTGYSTDGGDSLDSIVEYAWDWEGDGLYDLVGSETAPEHTYTVVGTYNPVLRVTDSKGLTDTDSGTVICQEVGTIETQSLTGGPFYVTTPSVTLLQNGCPAIAFTGGARPGPQYFRALRKDVTAWAPPTVLGNAGGECSIELINGNPAVTYIDSGHLYYRRSTEVLGEDWTPAADLLKNDVFAQTISLREVAGAPAVAYGGEDGGLSFLRALDGLGQQWPSEVTDVGSSIASTLLEVNGKPSVSGGLGSQVVYRQAQDIDGLAWNTTQVVPKGGFDCAMCIVEGAPALVFSTSSDGFNNELFYTRALDPDGNTWPPPVDLLCEGTNPSLAEINGLPAISFYDALNISVRYMAAADVSGASWSLSIDLGKGGQSSKLIELEGLPLVCYATAIIEGESEDDYQVRFAWGF